MKRVFSIQYSVFSRGHRIPVFIILMLVFFCPKLADAHGGGVPFVSNEPLGEFTASVWLDPSPLEVGQVHVTVALGKDESVVLNQVVHVRLIADGGARLDSLATHENAANRFLYEADFAVSEAGNYQLEVRVDGQDEQLAFSDIMIQESSWVRSPWLGVVALTIVVALWFLNRGGDARRGRGGRGK